MLERLRLLPWLPENLFRRKRYLPVWLCAIVGCGISGFAAFQVWKGEREAKSELFQQEAHNLTMALQKTITEHLQVPQDIDLFYETTYFLAEMLNPVTKLYINSDKNPIWPKITNKNITS
ncbi:MAG: hypothetical protein Fur0025_01280 [Oscillatoriaceae cyanobacterium]